MLIKYFLNVGIQSFAFGQHFIQFVLSQHGTQGGLCQLTGGIKKVFDLDDRLVRFDDTEIDNGIYLHRYIVA